MTESDMKEAMQRALSGGAGGVKTERPVIAAAPAKTPPKPDEKVSDAEGRVNQLMGEISALKSYLIGVPVPETNSIVWDKASSVTERIHASADAIMAACTAASADIAAIRERI